MSRRWLTDTAERVALTFAEAFLAALNADGILDLVHQAFDTVPHNVDLSAVEAAAVAGLAAALAVAKAALASLRGDRNSASLAKTV